MAEMNRCARWAVNHLKARANARLFRTISSRLQLVPEAACLEIGCGNANMAVRIVNALRPARYVATDLDPRQLDAAAVWLERSYPSGRPAGLELRLADALALPFEPASFDVVFAFAALHHAGPSHRDSSRLPDALAEVTRVLRPGGQLVYEEFRFTRQLRAWLVQHGYRPLAERRRWRREIAVWRAPEANVPVPASSA